MRSPSRLASVLLRLVPLALLLALGVRPAQAAPEPLVAVPSAVPDPALLRQAHALGLYDSAAPISLALTLPLHDQGALRDLLRRLYDRSDPAYGQYLTGAEFDAQFAPTAADYQAVADFARSRGLTVTAHTGRTVVGVSGTSAAVEAAFGVRLNSYRMPDGRMAYANDVAPQVPASVAARLGGIFGLDTLAVPKSHQRRPSAARILADAGWGFNPLATGSGPVGGFAPSDIKSVYNLNSLGIQGEGQSLALLELDGYSTSDIARYITQFTLPTTTAVLTNIPINGGVSTPGGGQGEVVLDIDMMLALVPKAQHIYVYEAADTLANALAIDTQIADDDTAKSISSSWGLAETQIESGSTTAQYTSFFDAENTEFMKMATQGQSFFNASGDSGAYDDGVALSVDDPASQPFVTGVGGTNVTVTAGGTPQISYSSETAWGDPNDTRRSPFGAGGGGGSSIFWPKPSYQYTNSTAMPPTGPLGVSATMRDVPDVSLYADADTGGYDIFVAADGATFETVAGTSAAAPLWAAFSALVNEVLATGSTTAPTTTPGVPASPLGFANPAIYGIGTGRLGNYASDFHDVTTGNNLFYSAATGYDDATGWGSFNGANLIADLAGMTTTTTLVTSVNPSVYGQPVTFTATVTGSNLTGTVTFTRSGTGTAVLGVAPLTGGVATLTTTVLPVGSDLITATYSGNAGNASSSGTVTQTVNKAATTTGLTSNANPSLLGQAVTFTATVHAVSPGAGTPTGNVTFTDTFTTPATVLGTATLSSGVATLTDSALAAGSHTITATYNGSPDYTASTSASLLQVGDPTGATAGLTATPTSSVFGQPVTFTCTVTVPAGDTNVPTGTVTFSVAGSGGTITLGTEPLSGGIATLTTAALPVGSDTVTAAYSGDTHTNSTSASRVQTVGVALTTTGLTSSAATRFFGQSLTLTAVVAAVSPGAGVPTGTVTFTDTSTSPAATLGTGTLTNGQATFTTTALSAGSHAIVATYGGDGDFAGSASGTLTQTVRPVLHTFPAGLQMIAVTESYGSAASAWSAPVGQILYDWGGTAYSVTTNLPTPGTGAWVRLAQPASVIDTGTPVPTNAPYSISLQTGWNLVGDPFASPVALSAMTATAGGKTYPLSGPQSLIYTLLYTYPAGANTYQETSLGGSLTPFAGYWMYALQPCTLTFPAP